LLYKGGSLPAIKKYRKAVFFMKTILFFKKRRDA
jgi:hypothetical protein